MDEAQATPDLASELTSSQEVNSRYIHSHIYNEAVSYDDDLIGLVAYGLYQKKKRRWILAFEVKNQRSPSETEVKDYCFTYQKHEVQELRVQAETLLYGVAEQLLQERMPGIRETALNSRLTQELGELRSDIRAISGYRHHIVGHVVGFFVLVLLASFVTFALSHEPSIAGFLLNKK
jgi:hypothetical protein